MIFPNFQHPRSKKYFFLWIYCTTNDPSHRPIDVMEFFVWVGLKARCNWFRNRSNSHTAQREQHDSLMRRLSFWGLCFVREINEDHLLGEVGIIVSLVTTKWSSIKIYARKYMFWYCRCKIYFYVRISQIILIKQIRLNSYQHLSGEALSVDCKQSQIWFNNDFLVLDV